MTILTSGPRYARSATPPPSRSSPSPCWPSASAPAPPSSPWSTPSSCAACPFDEHDRLAVVLEHDTRRPITFGGGTTTPQMYLDWRTMQESFDGLAAVGGEVVPPADRGRRAGGRARPARHLGVLSGAARHAAPRPLVHRGRRSRGTASGRDPELRVLAAPLRRRPRRGRQDDRPERGDAGRSSACSRATSRTRSSSDRPTEIFAPDRVHGRKRRRGPTAGTTTGPPIGRLKRGVSIEQAHEQMNRVAVALDEQYPKWSPGRRVRVVTPPPPPGRARAAVDADAARRGRARAAHRLRQRRQPDARARDRAEPRDGDSGGARRRPVAARARAAGRRRGALARAAPASACCWPTAASRSSGRGCRPNVPRVADDRHRPARAGGDHRRPPC